VTGLLLLLVAALHLGCNGEKKKPAAESTTPTGGSAAPDSSDTGGGAKKGPDKTYVIGWSVWTGWMPFKLMKEKGFLDKRAKEHGVKIELKEFKGYMDSVTAYSAKKLDGCAMTSMESLQPASSGVESIGILVNDTSNGGDGVLARKGMKLEDLKGETILLEEFSVSHYLLVSALESVGLKEKDVKVKNIPGDDAGKAFLTDDKVKVVTTWNPHLFKATEGGKGEVLYSSKDIPNEIIDFLIVSAAALEESPALGQALTDAWFDAMDLLQNTATTDEAIEIMAKGAGASKEEFNKMLAATNLFKDRKKNAEFLEGDTIKATMKKVKQFSFDHGLVKDDKFTIGFGKDAKDKLRFDGSYIKQ